VELGGEEIGSIDAAGIQKQIKSTLEMKDCIWLAWV
jgi:hypothetical protein